MRCFLAVEMDDAGSRILMDAGLDASSSDTDVERQRGGQFRDMLLSVIGVSLKGEDDGSDILSGKAAGRRRIRFSYRRNTRGGFPYWEMSLPDDVLLGKCPESVSKVFRTLSLTMLSLPYVRPTDGTSRFAWGVGHSTKPPTTQETT